MTFRRSARSSDEGLTGRVVPPGDIEALATAIAGYAREPQTWNDEAQRAVELARRYTYERYLSELIALFESFWNVRLSPRSAPGDAS